MAVLPHELSREKGDGSRSEGDDMYEEAAYRHDERSDTETTFWRSDIEALDVSRGRKRQLHRMLRRQEGENQGEPYQSNRRMRRDANRDEWKRRQLSIYCSKLEVTKHQRRRAMHIVEQLSFSAFGSYTTEQCILGTINVAAREDGWFIEDEDAFKDLMIREEIAPKGMRNIRKLIRKRL